MLDSLRQMQVEQLPELLGELEVIRATALVKMSALSPAPQRDELLNTEGAAARIGVSTDYLYRHAQQFPFTRRIGRKLLFSSLGIDAYIREKNSHTVLTARQQKRILTLSTK